MSFYRCQQDHNAAPPYQSGYFTQPYFSSVICGPLSEQCSTVSQQGVAHYGYHRPASDRTEYQLHSYHGNYQAPQAPLIAPQQFYHGRRKGLFIGINYFGQRGQLRRCINDVKNMSAYLNQIFGYAREDMVILTDDQQHPMSHPIKLNILRAMHWLVREARPNDSLFFHYSGYVGQIPNSDGAQEDSYDKAIYPVDFRTQGHIADSEMHRIMVKSLAPGVKLTAIFDSHHSSSAIELP